MNRVKIMFVTLVLIALIILASCQAFYVVKKLKYENSKETIRTDSLIKKKRIRTLEMSTEIKNK